LDLEDVNFITEPYSHFATRNFKYKRRFSHISANSPINHLWAELANIPIDEYWSKGTVSYTALNSARLLGCSRIISVGQDLAYIEGQCYSKDSAYKDLVCGENPDTGRWEIVAKDFDTFAKNLCTSPDEKTREVFAKRRLQNLNNSLHLVKGISGKMLPTESVYATFVKVLSEYTENFNDVEYINASLVGAQIDGFKNMPLEEALQGLEAIGGIELNTEFNYDKSTIKQVLGFKFDELKSILPQISEGKKYIKSIKNDLSRYKSVNEDILKTLKKISVNYLYLSSDFSNKSKLFDFMMVAEKIDLDYQMKMTTQFTYDSVTAFIDLLSKYYNNVELRIAEIEKIINKTIEVI